MTFVYLLSWWYTTGWRQQMSQAARRVALVLDVFSLGILMKTLFAPFRQISSHSVSGGVNVQLRAFFDKLISRFVGAMVRSLTLITGIFVLIFTVLAQMVLLVGWGFTPLLPLVALTLTLGGWVPWGR